MTTLSLDNSFSWDLFLDNSLSLSLSLNLHLMYFFLLYSWIPLSLLISSVLSPFLTPLFAKLRYTSLRLFKSYLRFSVLIFSVLFPTVLHSSRQETSLGICTFGNTKFRPLKLLWKQCSGGNRMKTESRIVDFTIFANVFNLCNNSHPPVPSLGCCWFCCPFCYVALLFAGNTTAEEAKKPQRNSQKGKLELTSFMCTMSTLLGSNFLFHRCGVCLWRRGMCFVKSAAENETKMPHNLCKICSLGGMVFLSGFVFLGMVFFQSQTFAVVPISLCEFQG